MDTEDKHLLVVDSGNYRVQKINATTGAFVGSIGHSSTVGSTCSVGRQSSWCVGGTFISSSSDGGFSNASYIAIDTQNNFFYVSSYYIIQKFNLTTGGFIGTIGKASGTGSCDVGKQSHWCTGGVFSSGSGDGEFVAGLGIGIDLEKNYLLVGGNGRVQRFDLATGAFSGAIGFSDEVGTCNFGSQKYWCENGSFLYGRGDGMFQNVRYIQVANSTYYFSDENRIQRVREQ